MVNPEGAGLYHLESHAGRVNIRSVVRQLITQYDESLDWIDRSVGARRDVGADFRPPGAIDEITQGTARGTAVTVEAMFQGQLEGAKSLYLTDNKEVIVKERANDSVSRTIERCLNFFWYAIGKSDACEYRMMICECHGAGDAIFYDRQIREARVGL